MIDSLYFMAGFMGLIVLLGFALYKWGAHAEKATMERESMEAMKRVIANSNTVDSKVKGMTEKQLDDVI